MKVAIVGYGVEGRAALTYWQGLGDDVTVLDADEKVPVPNGVKSRLGADYLKDMNGFDLVVRTGGNKPWEFKTKAPVTSSTQEFFEHCPAQIIGVTGTKGKGTTSTLIAKILEAAGRKVWLGGNIGVPVLGFLPEIQASDLVVMEMSSFQLLDLERSPQVAVCLMIAPEHLDWHRSFEEYVTAKGNIFAHQQAGDLAVYNPQNKYSEQISRLSRGRRVPYLEPPGAVIHDGQVMMGSQKICSVSEVGLIGRHNLENVCAAVTATWDLVNHDPQPVRQAVKAFTGLAHRLEMVTEMAGVKYVNDSFSSNPIATMAALEAFAEPKVVILGGTSRGLDFGDLASAVAAGNVRAALLIGETAPKIQQALKSAGFEHAEFVQGGMTAIVAKARAAAKPGDVVLLSPGCPSFDMFRNFSDRGDQFKEAVTAGEAAA